MNQEAQLVTISVHTQEWEGPFIDRFQVYDDTHGDVVQYRCQLEKTVFRYYAPKPFLKGVFGTEWPEVLVVSVGKTDLPLSEMGFRGKAIPPKTDTGFWEYQYSTRKEQPVNSWLYEITYEGQRYSLYVPHEVMEGKPAPKRLIVRVGVPE